MHLLQYYKFHQICNSASLLQQKVLFPRLYVLSKAREKDVKLDSKSIQEKWRNDVKYDFKNIKRNWARRMVKFSKICSRLQYFIYKKLSTQAVGEAWRGQLLFKWQYETYTQLIQSVHRHWPVQWEQWQSRLALLHLGPPSTPCLSFPVWRYFLRRVNLKDFTSNLGIKFFEYKCFSYLHMEYCFQLHLYMQNL
jgi:hypothetical protein